MRSFSSSTDQETAQGSVTQEAPYNASSSVRALDVTIADASITLDPGLWEVFQTDATLVIACLGSATAVPASGDPAVPASFWIPGSTVCSFRLNESTDFHAANVAAGNATLYFTKKSP